MSKLTVTCVAVDFGGTIATPGPSPRGRDVVAVLENRFGWSTNVDLEGAIDTVRAEAKAAYRSEGVQTPWETILSTASRRVNVELPDLRVVVGSIWDTVPDAAADPLAVEAVRRLRDTGRVLILACNTQRPIAHRRQTLAAAGLADCFAALVLSSEVGVGKPDPRFYTVVADAARARTGCAPGNVLFVGDTLDKDVTGPLASGMRAALMHSGSPPTATPDDVPIITHLTELPRLLERWP